MSQTNERAFETYVEEILLTRGGGKSGSNAEWDTERALLPAQVLAQLETRLSHQVPAAELVRVRAYRTAHDTPTS